MSEWLVHLANFLPMLFVGTTVLLGLGCLTILLTASPIHRQRLGELTVGATLLWMLLGVTPLPRLLPPIAVPLAWHVPPNVESMMTSVECAPTTEASSDFVALSSPIISLESKFDSDAMLEPEDLPVTRPR